MIHEYLHILRDPAHLMVEVTLMLVIDVLFLGIVWPFLKRALRKHDRDTHGIAYDQEGEAAGPWIGVLDAQEQH